MKKLFKLGLNVLGSALICLAFASCENFLKGAETKKELDKLIAEANAPTVEVYITADKEAGEVSPAGLYTTKLGKSFSVMFVPNNGYQFSRWEVLDRKTGEVIEGAVSFEDPTAAETKAKVLKNIANIQINAVYLDLPRVVTKSPEKVDSGVYANMPIKCTFNHPLQDENGEPIVFDFTNVNIMYGGENISYLFNAPVLSIDNLILTIKPDVQQLLEFIESKKLATLDITVRFTSSIKTFVDGKEYSLYQNENSDWTYRVNTETKTTTPVITELTVTNRPKDSEKYSDANMIPQRTNVNEANSFTESDIYNRRAYKGKIVYLYGTCYDAADGLQSIVVKEKLVADENANILSNSGWDYATDYSYDNCILTSKGNGYYDFIIAHELKESSGAVCVEAVLKDVVEAESAGKDYTVIKYELSALQEEDKSPINWVLNVPRIESHTTNGIAYTYTYHYEEVVFSQSDFDNNLRIIKFINPNGNFLHDELTDRYNNTTWNNYTISEHLYGNYYFSETKFDIFCKYKSRSGIVEPKMNYNSQDKYWYLALEADDLGGLQLDFTIIDDMDAAETRTYYIPVVPNVVDKVPNWQNSQMEDIICNCSTPGSSLYAIMNNYDEDETTLLNTYAASKSNGLSKYTVHDYTGQCFYRNSGLAGPMKTIDLQSIPVQNDSLPLIQIEEPVIGEPNRDGKCLIKIPLSMINSDDSIWDVYDTVLYNYTTSTADNDRIELEPGAEELCFYYSGADLCERNLYITVLGKKDGEKSQPTKRTIIKLSEYKIGYDTVPPEIMVEVGELMPLTGTFQQRCLTFPNSGNSSAFNYFVPVIFLEDEETGIKSINWWTDENNTLRDDYESCIIRALSATSFDIALPLCDLNLDRNNVRFMVRATDLNDNSTVETIDVKFKDGPVIIPEYVTGSGSKQLKITCKSKTPLKFWEAGSDPEPNLFASTDSGTRFVIYEPSATRDGWDYYSDRRNLASEMSPTQENDLYTYTDQFDISAKSNKFLKIVVEPIDETEVNGELYKIQSKYIYTFNAANIDKTFIETSTGMWIASNGPVMIHTLSTKTKYNICKDWTVEQWELYHKESGLIFPERDNNNNYYTCNYKIDNSAISSGECYVIIAYFADNTVRMSNVKQMP